MLSCKYLSNFRKAFLPIPKTCLPSSCGTNRLISNTTKQVSTPILYIDEASPPVRFVLMTASYLNIKLRFEEIDLFAQQNLSVDYKEINPLGKVPSLVDANTRITDSHAIALYLCQKYEDRRLYPTDALVRARVNEMLFYNSGTLFPIDSAIFCEYFACKSSIDDKQKDLWASALNFLNDRLCAKEWLSGSEMTLSDLCCGATISSLELLLPISKEHEHVMRWLLQLKQQPFYYVNEKGLNRLQEYMRIVKH